MTNPLIKVFRSKVNTAIILLIILLCIGIVGFKLLNNYMATGSDVKGILDLGRFQQERGEDIALTKIMRQ